MPGSMPGGISPAVGNILLPMPAPIGSFGDPPMHQSVSCDGCGVCYDLLFLCMLRFPLDLSLVGHSLILAGFFDLMNSRNHQLLGHGINAWSASSSSPFFLRLIPAN